MNKPSHFQIIPLLLFSLLCSVSFVATAQQENSAPALPGGVEYTIVKHGSGTRHPSVGDIMEIYVKYSLGDSVLFDSQGPVPFQMQATRFRGDITECFPFMAAGDSAIITVPVDTMKEAGQGLPWWKSGALIRYNVALISVKTPEQAAKDNEEKAARQKERDDKILQRYFSEHNIRPMKMSSGIYYTIAKAGSGDNLQKGQSVTVNYTGRTLDGKVFDSNTEPRFNHVSPFTFELGMKHVIKGWDEGVAFMKKGEKATLYIPSGLAYGPNGNGPDIVPNAVLVFDVEIVSVK